MNKLKIDFWERKIVEMPKSSDFSTMLV